jgi:hypothetical protein
MVTKMARKKMTRGMYSRLAIGSINDAVECFDAGFPTIAEVNDEMGQYYLYKSRLIPSIVDDADSDYEE